MNKFREKLIEFIIYMKDYTQVNLVLMLILCISFLWVVFPNIYFLSFFTIATLAFPIPLLHLVEEPKNRYLVDKKFSKKDFIPLTKHYLNKYLKSFGAILFILIISLFLIYSSMFLTYGIIFANMERSLGSTIVLFGVTFILYEGFSILFSMVGVSIIIERFNVGVIKALYLCKKNNKKKSIKHLLSIAVFAIFTIPIIMLSDAFSDVLYLSTMLRVGYFLLLINYSIFDMKRIIDGYDLTLPFNKPINPKKDTEKQRTSKNIKKRNKKRNKNK